ncbi:UNKNOWN [Stylonychia lemnae]|uniref:Uncharacterized protein n=1 Tax=Stylonychia lemnae TaxID=5949 RepID=A0A078ABG8_STYLE|nr:UNKNOWN [Stylonychia lemnae]|eukprot:CDW78917.1 UNKNOWN [Stylonychia lemnae]
MRQQRIFSIICQLDRITVARAIIIMGLAMIGSHFVQVQADAQQVKQPHLVNIYSPAGNLSKLVINIIRSVMFMTSFVMSIKMVECYGKGIHWASVLISGFGIIFEQPHKRVEISYYVFPKALESLWNYLERRGLVHILFALAIGMLAMSYGEGKNTKTLRGFSYKACNYMWNDLDKLQKQKTVEKKQVELKQESVDQQSVERDLLKH